MVDVGHYRYILQQCFPSLDLTQIVFIGGGTYRVFEADTRLQPRTGTDADYRLIFRFTHGNQGHNLLKRERDLCHLLGTNLPARIPSYEFYSNGCDEFPWPVAGYRRLPGIPLQDAGLSRPGLDRLASQIGGFLAALHSTSPGPLRSADLPHWDPSREEDRLGALYEKVRTLAFSHFSARQRAWTSDLFESFLASQESSSYKPVLVHGDLDSSNILCEPADNTLLGILDFEEACLGDPAWDFCVLLAEYGTTFFGRMLQAYDIPLDAGFRERVAFHSQRILFHESLYGIEYGERRFSQHALERLRRAMDGIEPTGGWLAASTAESRNLGGCPP